MPRSQLSLPMLKKKKKEPILLSLTEVPSIQLLEVKLMMQELLQLVIRPTQLKMQPKQENASYIISMKLLIHNLQWELLFMEKLMLKEEILLELSILELISFTQLQEEFSVLTFGKMVQRKLKPTLTQILLTMLQFPKKKKCRLRTKPTESFWNAILSANISKVRKKLNLSMDSTSIKEVLFPATLSEL